MRIIEIKETGSTNSWVTENLKDADAPCMVYALRQTAGRGQRGNSWEAEPDKNLTASFMLRPENVAVASQFVISEAVALAVVDLLRKFNVEALVKWPNDVYVGDRKICGILIEHSIMGMGIRRTVAGVGININQTLFLSDAPNPVSLAGITGREYSIPEVAALLADCVGKRMSLACAADDDGRRGLHEEFVGMLWRGGDGLYPFFDRKRGEGISARIMNVAPDGMLTLQTEDGELREYAFKEVEFVL
ncbi:MAG: biotin--[acetyl-CoA-carboxylase] ligase [Muribaculaceae bacterium]|nr:biotin--[acetyl-CoA-carboxylase] ligase [Muribaculaceae bacterium]